MGYTDCLQRFAADRAISRRMVAFLTESIIANAFIKYMKA